MSKLGVIIVDHGSKVASSNGLFEEFVREFKEDFEYSIVEAAHMELANPNIHDAFSRCLEQDADSVLIVPYFFFPGRHLRDDIPKLCEEASKFFGEIPFRIAEPLGLHPLMRSIVADRIEENVGEDPQPYLRSSPNVIV